MGTRGAPHGAPAPFPEPAAMTETLFERYKEALRAGHVAVVRGRLEEAVAAYREAIAIAPDRAVPHGALGGVYLRVGDPAAALEAYEAALAIAPDDDPAMLGRAQALVVLRRTADAAATYDRLATVRAEGDRPADAVEAARRALAIEPTDVRRARHADLVERLRETAGAAVADGASLETGAADVVAADAPRPTAEPGAASPAPRGPDPEVLVAAVEEAVARGDVEAAGAGALQAARAYRSRDQLMAAFDVCLLGIGARPADVQLHLLLADLSASRGWTGHAGDTYRNLLRLVELDGDVALAEVIRATAAEHLPGDPRFGPA
jgi:hypothetical protein